MKEITVKLINGDKVKGDKFSKKDYIKLKKIFKKWLKINKQLKSLKGRGMNVPDVFSEALFCLEFNAIRTNSDSKAKSYDCVMRKTGEGVQVKSASISEDLTSFGPKSTWDLLYFVDFAPNGHVDGEVWFYKIAYDKATTDEIHNLVVNKKNNETFSYQQSQGRRPRFSIKEKIIKKNSLSPVKKINLLDL